MKINAGKLQKILLLTIIIVAAFLRIWKISEVPVSLFGDEVDVGYHAYSILKTGRDYQGNLFPLHFHSLAEWRTPLYLYASVPTVAVFGISPLGVRLPALIFGVLGIYGVYLLLNELLGYGLRVTGLEKETRNTLTRNEITALTAAFLLAINPWHFQYSRAGFEVTMLLTFLIFGLFFFFKALKKEGKYFWLSTILLVFTPWIYSTAKLFTPLLILFLTFTWRKEIFKFSKKELTQAVFAGFVIGLPIVYSTFFGGGTQRAVYTSVFTDPTTTAGVGVERTRDLIMRGELVLGSKPSLTDRLFHNKFVEWSKIISRNYLTSFSTDFLFNEGDPNPRHSPVGIGQFYKIEIIGLLAGLILFFVSNAEKKIKFLIGFWLVAGALPAELTRDGGNHATRLILILPPLTFLVAWGLVGVFRILPGKFKVIFLASYILLLTSNIVFYLHLYFVHYPWDSERWWHAGYGESFKSLKSIDKDFSKVIISMSGEPAWIFFAGGYQYDPQKWQKEFPIGNDEFLKGFGSVSHTDKYYFGSFNEPGKGIYNLGEYIDSKTLYLAVAKEIGANLILEPERTPANLNLIKAIPFPSGEPAYYIFSGK